MASKIKKGDIVYVITGGSKGVKGKVIRSIPTKNQVIVEGANMKVHYVKQSMQNPEGGMFRKEAPLHVSNVAVVDPAAQESLKWSKKMTTRVGFRINEDGKKVRFAKRSGQEINESFKRAEVVK